MIVISKPEIEEFHKYYGQGENEHSHIKEYIRFYTAHGNVNEIINEKLGFPNAEIDGFKTRRTKLCQLSVWLNDKFEPIEFGFPYLYHNNEKDRDIATPLSISRLRDGRFSSRHARIVKYKSDSYSFILAVDGNRKSHDEYKSLDRQGTKNSGLSGIKLSQQRGVFIASNGIRIIEHNELFSNVLLEGYNRLADKDAISHYQLIIDGQFDVVTNRNSLTAKSKLTLADPEFLRRIKEFLDTTKKNNLVFRELVDRLMSDAVEQSLEKQANAIKLLKDNITTRGRFKVNDILPNKLFVEPNVGEENLVGAIYLLFSNLVSHNSDYLQYWKRPLTMSSRGIDSLVVENETNPLDVRTEMLEYKTFFNASDRFNHPFKFTHTIVCWDIKGEVSDKDVCDDWDYQGILQEKDVGAEITEIQHSSGEAVQHCIKVICLRKLLEKTFDVTWMRGMSDRKKKSSMI